MTSDADRPSGRTGYRDALHAYTAELVRKVAQCGNPLGRGSASPVEIVPGR